ncbi:Hypothetical protein R9X50_00782100 [Acrodontium crateriforme]|uniref:Lysyl-tRNA synthetase n=1 Tax=Acrodontium crateriforme TaxID=150365 RepID=A0AAQ3MAS5_9PEZI|nr:Hypothetical protein R9X50_00782100 [Acrodontium crateriforme]
MSPTGVRRLRPYLFTNFQRAQYIRTFSAHPRRSALIEVAAKPKAPTTQKESSRHVKKDYEKRIAQIEAHNSSLSQCYPRLPPRFAQNTLVSIHTAREASSHLEPDETLSSGGTITIAGRVHSVRSAGSKLIFMDVKDASHVVQVVVQQSALEPAGVSREQFRHYAKSVREGDWYTVTGTPHRTARGEQSIAAVELPMLLSPSLHQIPETLTDAETRARHRHVDMLVNPEPTRTLRIRHQLERSIDDFLVERDFVKVQTPILTAGAGGAVARPFETEATELAGETLNLRIAPELWLKRLVVGGMDKVYEMGPAFRNEGVDATHNPEFTICEFYHAFATLDDLMTLTETLFAHMHNRMETVWQSLAPTIPPPFADIKMTSSFNRLEFIPTLEREMGQRLPDLSTPTATSEVLAMFNSNSLHPPSNPTLPRLLDSLAATYLEPLCTSTPTFITHHPAALSPLSKHFVCSKTSQTVAARAELFIHAREYANMYEEENSPFAQRAKFEQQLTYQVVDGEGDGRAEVDESYLGALEWGLPPTGGWGCGVDRLVMLFAGRERLGDVLSFGGLRNVVGGTKQV